MAKLIEGLTIEEDLNGMILGTPDLNMEFTPDPFPYDFHAAAKYVREHDLPGMTEDIMALFKY